MRSFKLDRKRERQEPSQPPYWYKDLKEFMWWLLGLGVVIYMTTRM